MTGGYMLEEKAAKIRLVFLDVDGVLTDGRIVMNHQGAEIKSFNVRDGLGLKILIEAGIEVAIVTGRKSDVVSRRAEELGIKEIHQGIRDKRTLCNHLRSQRRLGRDAVCCIGDDLLDLGMFAESGLTIAVADAVREIRERADLITENPGGAGAVRELCEILLKSQGKWDQAVARFA